MIFSETPLPGVFLLDAEPFEDERGAFSRTFAEEEYASHGLNPRVSQCSMSWNKHKGTLRGMHFQHPPHAEAKTIRCTRGRVYAVALDLRPDSDTYCSWTPTELSADNRRALYVPELCAFGFQSLEPATEILYIMSHPYAPSHYTGVRWDDPAFGIEWPEAPDRTISEKDRTYPDFQR